jgi:hypothetical protein
MKLCQLLQFVYIIFLWCTPSFISTFENITFYYILNLSYFFSICKNNLGSFLRMSSNVTILTLLSLQHFVISCRFCCIWSSNIWPHLQKNSGYTLLTLQHFNERLPVLRNKPFVLNGFNPLPSWPLCQNYEHLCVILPFYKIKSWYTACFITTSMKYYLCTSISSILWCRLFFITLFAWP